MDKIKPFLAKWEFINICEIFGLSGWLSGKALTFHQMGLGVNSNQCLVSGHTATLVGRVATPVTPASGTQPVDQG